MDVTNNEMDDGMRREEADRNFSIQNRNNNSSNYVGSRFLSSHCNGYPVPIRQDTGIDGRLFTVRNNQGNISVRSGPDGKGIVAVLRDELDQDSEYLIEINGSNGVEVTQKL
ncbi:hypothetical protein [Malikia spinosa]|uniref:Uncharacterized protein n=1 Tax=Malikia spinosa TaxID=86180 RepID=A0A7C9IXE5_9BURK|nr:hypothetical protein [Malikia spinosa]MYZ51287.1 hypothetical protein [Malikia spinosa]